MQQFNYTIQNPVGMDVRRIGLFTKLAKRYTDTTIIVAKGNQTVKAGQLMKMMGMSVKKGDNILVTVDGPAERDAFFNTRVFFENNL